MTGGEAVRFGTPPGCRPREEPLVTPDPTATPEPDFVSRHIGPDEADVAAMLKVVGQPSVAALLDTALPPVIRSERALAIDAAPSEAAVIDELRALASPQHGADLDDRSGLLRHAHAGGGAPQRAGEPRLVHRLHAVPAGDLPGPARGAAELPDRGGGPHRPDHRGGLAAGREHGRRRGDDPDAPRQQGRRGRRAARRRARPAAVHRRDARPAPGRSASTSSWPT